MREHLVGYLLNAVEPDEHKLVEEKLASDDSLRQDMKVLEWSLHPLSVDHGHHEPPQGLAQRCCQFVYSRTEVMPVALSPAGTIGGTVNKRRWSWLDLSVAGAIAVAAAVLLVPAIYQSNAHARLLACQNNLKDIGLATASYSDRHNGYYPAPNQAIRHLRTAVGRRSWPAIFWQSPIGNWFAHSRNWPMIVNFMR
jgi:hypothetical protein